MSGWFRGLRGKLTTLIILPAILLGVISYIAISGIRFQERDLKVIARERLPITQLVGEMQTQVQALSRFLWAAHAHETEPAKRRGFLNEARSAMGGFNMSMNKYQALPRATANQERFGEVMEQWSKVSQAAQEAIALLEKDNKEADDQAKQLIRTKLLQPSLAVSEALRGIQNLGDQITDSTVKEAEQTSGTAFTQLSILVSLGILFIMGFGFFHGTRVSGALGSVSERIHISANQTATASNQLNETSQQLSTVATEADASVEETVRSLADLSEVVKRNAENAKKASAVSRQGLQVAVEGETQIVNLIDAMRQTAADSTRIEEIIGLIEDIAFQTSLLALNASVEAARAGEQGKGFAVVAESVRELAGKTAEAVKDITGLVKNGAARANHGAQIATSSGDVLKKLVESVKTVAELNNQIAEGSEEQSTGIAQISQSMKHLDEATQGNAAAAEEVAASSQEMSSQASALDQQVAELIVVVEGSSEGRTAAQQSMQSMPANPVQRMEPSRAVTRSVA